MALYSQGKHEIYIDMVTYASYLMSRTSILYCNRKYEWDRGFVSNSLEWEQETGFTPESLEAIKRPMFL